MLKKNWGPQAHIFGGVRGQWKWRMIGFSPRQEFHFDPESCEAGRQVRHKETSTKVYPAC